MFVVGTSLLIVFLSYKFHLHFVLICLSAGFVVENLTSAGDAFIKAIERTSMTIYIVFFALAGAAINFGALKDFWYVVIALVVLRGLATWLATHWGAKAAGDSELMQKKGWYAFIAQAGISLGLASIVARTYPEWGGFFKTIVVATIGLNQIIGPISFKHLLTKARETMDQRVVKGFVRFPK